VGNLCLAMVVSAKVAIRDRLREQATRFLVPGEHLQEVMWGTSIRPLKLYTGMWLISDFDGYRAVICTDRRIILFRGGRWNATLEEVLATVDRNQSLGPPRGLYHRIPFFHPPIYVGRRFFRDIRRADAGLAGLSDRHSR
jgi:hypothetical protein